jgi:hypothetical protein
VKQHVVPHRPTLKEEIGVDEGARVVPAGVELKDPPSSLVDVRRGDALAFGIAGDALDNKCRKWVASPKCVRK